MKKHLFYKGENVTPEDLNTAFSVPEKQLAGFTEQFLFSDGVLSGFTVEKSGDFTLSISEGCALKNGLVLKSRQALSLELSTFLPSEGLKTITAGIARSIVYSDYVQNTDGLSVPRSSENSVSALAADELPAEYLPLYSIQLSPTAIVSITPVYNMLESLDALSQRTQGFINEEGTLVLNGSSLKIARPEGTKLDFMNALLPLGYYYPQIINEALGTFLSQESPASLLGGVWELRWASQGVSIRTEGNKSSQGRGSNGIQDFAMQRLTGNLGNGWLGGSYGQGGAVGVFQSSGGAGNNAWGGSGSDSRYNYTFDNARQALTDNETRMRNILVRWWQKVSY